MFAFALLAVATVHDPKPDDIYRFGYHVVKIDDAITRKIWLTAVGELREAEVWPSPWLVYGKEEEYRQYIAYMRYRERCWNYLDDLGGKEISLESKFRASKELKFLLGPVDYYLGNMP